MGIPLTYTEINAPLTFIFKDDNKGEFCKYRPAPRK